MSRIVKGPSQGPGEVFFYLIDDSIGTNRCRNNVSDYWAILSSKFDTFLEAKCFDREWVAFFIAISVF